MTDNEWLALIIGALLINGFYWAAACGYVATEKGRNGGGWTLAGFFGGVLLIGGVLAFLPLVAAPSKA